MHLTPLGLTPTNPLLSIWFIKHINIIFEWKEINLKEGAKNGEMTFYSSKYQNAREGKKK